MALGQPRQKPISCATLNPLDHAQGGVSVHVHGHDHRDSRTSAHFWFADSEPSVNRTLYPPLPVKFTKATSPADIVAAILTATVTHVMSSVKYRTLGTNRQTGVTTTRK